MIKIHFIISSFGLFIFLATVILNIDTMKENNRELTMKENNRELRDDLLFISREQVEKKDGDDVYCLIIERNEGKCYKFDHQKKEFVEIDRTEN